MTDRKKLVLLKNSRAIRLVMIFHLSLTLKTDFFTRLWQKIEGSLIKLPGFLSIFFNAKRGP